MRSAGIPLVLLFLALGLALSFAAPRARALSVFALVAAVAAFSLVPVPRSWLEGLFLGCWGSIIATGAMVHVRRSLPPVFAMGLAVNAAAWASGVATVTGSRLSLFEALPWVLILYRRPGSRLGTSRFPPKSSRAG